MTTSTHPRTFVFFDGPHFMRIEYDLVIYDDGDDDAIENVKFYFNGDLLRMIDLTIPVAANAIEEFLRKHAYSIMA